MKPGYLQWIVIVLSSILLFGCNSSKIKQAIQNQKPKVSIIQVRVIDIDFEQITLGFETQIDNPNPVDISLAGIDYDLHLQGSSFLKGNTRKPVSIKASSISLVELPLTIGFDQLKNSYEAIRDKTSVAYLLNLGLLIDIPVIGQYSHSVQQQGNLPVPIKPSIRLADIKINHINFNGAEVDVSIGIENPNPFSAILERLDYTLRINGQQWASGVSEKPGTIEANSDSTIKIPLNLQFSQMGIGLFKLLTGSSNIDYALSGDLKARVPEMPVGRFDLPINQVGTFKLTP